MYINIVQLDNIHLFSLNSGLNQLQQELLFQFFITGGQSTTCAMMQPSTRHSMEGEHVLVQRTPII